jgi:nucleotide-binding universal stress UspA family protein
MPDQPIIFAAVDLDRRAVPVLAHAARLAALCQGRLVLVHVVDFVGGFESDLPFPQSPGAVLDDMVRHARASLVGMVSHLDLDPAWVEIRVESGPVIETLAGLAGALKPRYCVIGQSGLGLLSPAAGLAGALKASGHCEILAVPGTGGGLGKEMLARVRRWVGADLGAPTGHPR